MTPPAGAAPTGIRLGSQAALQCRARASSRCARRSSRRRPLLVARPRLARTDTRRPTSTARCPRACAAASSSRSTSCRHASSTAVPTPAARSRGSFGSTASGRDVARRGRDRRDAARKRSRPQIPDLASRTTRGSGRVRRRTARRRVLVTPRLGALAGGVGGTLPLEIGGRRVPGARRRDRRPLSGYRRRGRHRRRHEHRTAVNTQVPGAGETNEIWLDVPPGGTAAAMAALARPPFRGVEAVSRDGLARRGARRPARATARCSRSTPPRSSRCSSPRSGSPSPCSPTCATTAATSTTSRPRARSRALLRRIVRVRALVVAIAGVIAGAVAGALLALLVTPVVAVTARATPSDLPLRTSFDLRVLARRRARVPSARGRARRARDPARVPRATAARRAPRSRAHEPRRGTRPLLRLPGQRTAVSRRCRG